MNVAAADVRWGRYGGYEGPYWPGRVKLEKPPAGAPFWERCLWVVSQTEGGAYDAVNMYDKCIFSPGLIQLCEFYGLATRMFGRFHAADAAALGAELARLPGSAAYSGVVSWQGDAFHDGQPVTTAAARRRFFLGGASGKEGAWTDEQRAHAREVCAVFATVLGAAVFRAPQRAHVGPMLGSFAVPSAKEALFSEPIAPDAMGYWPALQCAFLSFAGNLPGPAADALRQGMVGWGPGTSDRDKCIRGLQALTFAGVGIWPHRYNVIRPHLEEQFGVDLPDLASELGKTSAPEFGALFPTVELWQTALHHLGYDLGPAGVDGQTGPKTRAALKEFEGHAGIPFPDGVMDPATAQSLADAMALCDEARALELRTLSHDAWGLVAANDTGAVEVLMAPLRVSA